MPPHGHAAVVEGTLVIDAAIPPFRGATAHVYLEDISYADAPAAVVAELAIPGIDHDPSAHAGRDSVVPFSLRAPDAALAADRDYALRAWVDHDGDGDPGAGDLHSDQIHRVLTRGFGHSATISVGSD